MSDLSKNMEITKEKLKYLFDISFKSKINSVYLLHANIPTIQRF